MPAKQIAVGQLSSHPLLPGIDNFQRRIDGLDLGNMPSFDRITQHQPLAHENLQCSPLAPREEMCVIELENLTIHNGFVQLEIGIILAFCGLDISMDGPPAFHLAERDDDNGGLFY
jgi:hypothetical protein